VLREVLLPFQATVWQGISHGKLQNCSHITHRKTCIGIGATDGIQRPHGPRVLDFPRISAIGCFVKQIVEQPESVQPVREIQMH
jgi:hypothetical protein